MAGVNKAPWEIKQALPYWSLDHHSLEQCILVVLLTDITWTLVRSNKLIRLFSCFRLLYKKTSTSGRWLFNTSLQTQDLYRLYDHCPRQIVVAISLALPGPDKISLSPWLLYLSTQMESVPRDYFKADWNSPSQNLSWTPLFSIMSTLCIGGGCDWTDDLCSVPKRFGKKELLWW